MHILLALISAITGLLWILYRLHRAGVDLNALNPLLWYRRYLWQQQYGTQPFHQLETPLEAVGVILMLVIKGKGAVTRESKNELIQLFVSRFHLTQEKANEFYNACSYMIEGVTTSELEVPNILKPNKSQFTLAQVDSLYELMEWVAKLDGEPNENQQLLIDTVKREFELK